MNTSRLHHGPYTERTQDAADCGLFSLSKVIDIYTYIHIHGIPERVYSYSREESLERVNTIEYPNRLLATALLSYAKKVGP
jgi:hypothetical protein